VKSFLRHFWVSVLLTLATLLAVLAGLGPSAAVITLVLIGIEVAFSFDNAIINAKVLETLSHIWQQLFLTIGVILAIVGMRLIFPIVIVMLAANLGWSDVLNLALHHPHEYAHKLEEAHPAIAAFGGAFLLTLTLYFFWDEDKEIHWLVRLEKPVSRYGKKWLPALIAFGCIAIVATLPFNHHAAETLRAGWLGVAVYVGIKLFIDFIGKLAGPVTKGVYTGWAAFGVFMYLQVLDASFSFDGVIGAFAITNVVVLIAAGLGIGALWVRSLTVFMVERGVLSAYKYLEHGAHYAIGALAAALLASLFFDVPDAVTGVAGLGIIGASFLASREALQHEG